MKRILVAWLVVSPALALAQSNGSGDRVKVAPANDGAVMLLPSRFDLGDTYLVVEREGSTGVVPYADAKDCARFADPMRGHCISGADAKRRFGSK